MLLRLSLIKKSTHANKNIKINLTTDPKCGAKLSTGLSTSCGLLLTLRSLLHAPNNEIIS